MSKYCLWIISAMEYVNAASFWLFRRSDGNNAGLSLEHKDEDIKNPDFTAHRRNDKFYLFIPDYADYEHLPYRRPAWDYLLDYGLFRRTELVSDKTNSGSLYLGTGNFLFILF